VRHLLALVAALLLSLALALELVFLDVGQGDAVLIRSPSGQTVLYDAGEKHADALRQLIALGVERLDLVIASHAHADHIGGMADVILHYRPRFYLDNGLPHTTRTYERTLEAVLAVDAQLLEPTARRIDLGDVTLHVLPPPGIVGWGQNNNSVGVIVEYGAFRASLAGDAEPEQWAWWLANHRDFLPRVQVHKSSHHGSRNGDTLEAMRVLEPQVVVIGVAHDNRYGHPHEEALSLYAAPQIRPIPYPVDLLYTLAVVHFPSGCASS
jgi:competence protein ComEC